MKNSVKTTMADEEIASLLRRAGLSVTAQRIGLCRFVLCEARHPSVDEIKLWADSQGIKSSLATVYNTLHALCKAGIIKDLRFAHTDKVIYDNNIEPHHHFIDEETGEVYDLSTEEVELVSKLSNRFIVNGIDVVVRGKINHKVKS